VSHVEVDRRFRDAYCFHHQGDHSLPPMMAVMIEAVRTSEMSVIFDVTARRYIPEDSKLPTRRREKFKCHTEKIVTFVLAHS
jgi:hypothetical protein